MVKLVARHGFSAKRMCKAFTGSLGLCCVALCATFGLATITPASATLRATSPPKTSSLCTTYASNVRKQTAIANGTSRLSKAYIAANKSGSWPAIKKASLAEFKELASLDKALGSALSDAPRNVKAVQSTIIEYARSKTEDVESSTSNKQLNGKIMRFETPQLINYFGLVTAFVTKECSGEVATTTP